MATAMTSAQRTTRRVYQERPIGRALRERIDQILGESYAFMDSPALRHGSAESRCINFDTEPQLPAMGWYQPTAPGFHPEETRAFPKIMKRDEERLMFLCYNNTKRHLSELQRRVKHTGPSRVTAAQVIEWHRRLTHYRDYLVRTNLALVLAMARRMRPGAMDFAEMISEGNMALLRAIEKFDVERGFKFSTYACRAILKAISRTSMKHRRYRTRFLFESDLEIEQSDRAASQQDAIAEDGIEDLRRIVDRNQADLSENEQTVIRRRFNWNEPDQGPLTLEEVGHIIGVSKERVRQIQNMALAKIRGRMEAGMSREQMLEARFGYTGNLESDGSPFQASEA